MSDPQRPPWFGPKRFGYGIRPQAWQGWALMLGLIFGLIALAVIVIAVVTPR